MSKTASVRILTGSTRIRLSQIKDLKSWIRDRTYKVGEISEKTGLKKFGPGDWREPGKSSWRVPRSLGAAAKPYYAKNATKVLYRGREFLLPEGSKVTDIEIIAKGHGIDKARHLVKKYRRNGKETESTDWSKKKGVGTVVDKKGRKYKAELHWYECKGLGKIEFKVKRWIE